MTQADHDPSMEEILASIRKVIDEDKELQGLAPATTAKRADSREQEEAAPEEDVLELDQPLVDLAAAADPGPPLVSDSAADSSRQSLAALADAAASAPPPEPQSNPLEAMVREMLRPILKEWLDDHLPEIVDSHVKREIARITGKPL